MRAQGEGTVQKVGKKWRGVLTRSGKRFFGPLTESKAHALTLARLAADKRELLRQSFGTCLKDWIDRQRLAPTTRSLYRTIHRTKVERDPIGSMDVAEITEKDLRAFKSRIQGSAATVNNALTLVQACLKAEGNRNRIPVPMKRPKPKSVLTLDERERALNYGGNTIDQLIIHLALLCGLRRSEIAGLMHEDRDGVGMWIRRAVVNVEGTIHVKETKTRSSESWVPIVGEVLKREIGPGKGFVLGKGNRPIDPLEVSRRWERVRTEIGLTCGLHALRRSYGMALLESGTDVATTAELMRHSPTELLRDYARSRRDLKEAAVKRAFEA